MDRVLLLGTGTCELQETRRASSVLVEVGGLRVVFDLGRGIADRLASLGLRQDDLCHVVFSHFHPDHVSDLIPFLHAAAWSQTDPRSQDLHLWGPEGLESQIERFLGLFPIDNLTRDTWSLHVHELKDDRLPQDVESFPGMPVFEIEGRRFGWPSLPPSGNHGLVFEADLGGDSEAVRRVAITGDSSFHDAEVRTLRGCDIAIFDSGHLIDDEIVELMVQTNVPRLIASHVYRELDVPALEEQANRRGFEGSLEVGSDLQDLGRGPVAGAPNRAGITSPQ